jgi:hypothetical protein
MATAPKPGKRQVAKVKTPPPPKPDLVAELMLQRQERVNRARAAILEICQKERVDVVVAGFDITADGKIRGRLNIVALDQI